ncbi:MAG: methyltransferase [Spirochaetota bacterium]
MAKTNKQHLSQKLWQIASNYLGKAETFIPIEQGKKIKLERVFAKEHTKYVLELGSGWGEVALNLAKENPQTGFVLMEKNRGRVKYTLRQMEKRNINNIRFIPINFHWFLEELFQAQAFAKIILNFPDPWPKKKHHKHRTLNTAFLDSLDYLLQAEGIFLFATDYAAYGRQAIRVFRPDKRFYFPEKEYSFQRTGFPISAFEQEKRDLGKTIYYLERRKKV